MKELSTNPKTVQNREFYQLHKKLGLCVRCSEKAIPGTVHCLLHKLNLVKVNKARYTKPRFFPSFLIERAWCERYGITSRQQRRRFTSAFCNQLSLCKSDEARNLIVKELSAKTRTTHAISKASKQKRKAVQEAISPAASDNAEYPRLVHTNSSTLQALRSRRTLDSYFNPSPRALKKAQTQTAQEASFC